MHTRRHGFTLVELLVVISIIGMLVALLLPAVQHARESARRMQCSNNLKQIGLALHNYHDSHRTFPVSMVGPGQSHRSGYGTGYFSWLALLLPFAEQTPLADSINFNVNMADAGGVGSYISPGAVISSSHANAPAAQVRVPTFVCPSDSFSLNDNMGTARPMPNSYCGNAGWPWCTTGIDGLRQSRQHNGVIPLVNPATAVPWHTNQLRLELIRDGSSHTIAVTERVITILGWGDLYSTAFPEREKSYCAGYLSAKPLRVLNWYCDIADFVDGNYTLPQGRAWISGWSLAANTYTHVRPINSRNCHVHGGEKDGSNLISPSSAHDHGVNVVMADGSVHFVMESIDMPAWWALGSRDGGETGAELP